MSKPDNLFLVVAGIPEHALDKWDIRGFHTPLVIPGSRDLFGETVLYCAFRSEHDAYEAEIALEGMRGVSMCAPAGVEFQLFPEALEIRACSQMIRFEIRPALRVGEQNPITGALVLPSLDLNQWTT